MSAPLELRSPSEVRMPRRNKHQQENGDAFAAPKDVKPQALSGHPADPRLLRPGERLAAFGRLFAMAFERRRSRPLSPRSNE